MRIEAFAARTIRRTLCSALKREISMNPNMADVAALVGDPARATMLTSLLDGRSLTALELACSAGVTPQTASFHLLKMTQKDLLTAVKQGRHRYYKLATPLVAHMLEGIMAVAANVSAKPVPPPRVDAEMKRARTCYDHLAGTLGVAITDALIERRYVLLDDEAGEVTERGLDFFSRHDIVVEAGASRRVFCRPCLDWSERRPHLAGRVGATLARHFFAEGWIRRQRRTRTVDITRAGETGFHRLLGIRL